MTDHNMENGRNRYELMNKDRHEELLEIAEYVIDEGTDTLKTRMMKQCR